MFKIAAVAVSFGWFACDYCELGKPQHDWPPPGSRIAPDDISPLAIQNLRRGDQPQIRVRKFVDIDDAVSELPRKP
jgi:hypothetical protein